jgi:hypothetical protein
LECYQTIKVLLAWTVAKAEHNEAYRIGKQSNLHAIIGRTARVEVKMPQDEAL